MTATGVTQDASTQATPMAPAIIRPSVRQHSIKVELCTPAIGAELSNISLADAALDPDAIAEIRALWLGNIVAIENWKTSLGIEPKDLTAFN
jgi:taurine dioxygenase